LSDDYDVLAEGVIVGRIMQDATAPCLLLASTRA
jgi:hypothetical protein